MKLHFHKMHGCGNDFLFLDCISSSKGHIRPREIQYLCDRHFGVGADGLVMLSLSEEADAQWNFFNSDGTEAEMCGNAARCAIRYLVDHYFPGDETISLKTKVGVIRGRKLSVDIVEVTLLPQKEFTFEYEETVLEVPSGVLQVYNTNTGVPHAVIEVKDLYSYPVDKVGREVQKHAIYEKEGTNVTFFQRLVGSTIRSTTFERGVEAETLACGTGAAASALMFCELYMENLPVGVNVPGGELQVDVSPVSKVLLLRGPTDYVFEVDVQEIPQTFEKPVPFEEMRKRQ